MPHWKFKGLAADIPTIDFSGWPMVVRPDMPDDIVYALCEAIELRRAAIPTDNFRPLDIADLCANGAEAPTTSRFIQGQKSFTGSGVI